MQKVTVNIEDHIVTNADRLARLMAVEENRNVSRSEIISKAVHAFVLKELRKREKEQANATG